MKVQPKKYFYTCLAVACVILIVFAGSKMLRQKNGEEAEIVPTEDLIPMVYVNSQLYQLKQDQPEWDFTFVENLEYLGIITSCVDSGEIPCEELQANDEIVGAKVYQRGEEIIVVFGDEYWLYTSVSQDSSD